MKPSPKIPLKIPESRNTTTTGARNLIKARNLIISISVERKLHYAQPFLKIVSTLTL